MAGRLNLDDLLFLHLLRQLQGAAMAESDSDEDDSTPQQPTFRVTSTAQQRPVQSKLQQQNQPQQPASQQQRATTPASPQNDDYVVVVAVDFGTTFSGYAFSFRGKQDAILMNKNWGSANGFSSYKTPTSVLADAQGEFVSFGYDAQSKYSTMTDEEAQKYYYFERFKMVLHHNMHLTRDTEVQSANGKTFKALAVFTMSLKYLKEHFIETVSKQIDGTPNMSLIRWVVTVPAIWTDASKQFMREAALKAGLINNVDSQNLLIALEPEAASIYCRSLDIQHFVACNQSTAKNKMTEGTRYLVIDAGGGTLDVTAHEVVSGGKVKEIFVATGGDHGGIKVDAEYIDVLEDIFGKKFIDVYKKDCASQWLQLLANFEKQKREIKPDTEMSTNMPLSWGFASKFREVMGHDVEKVFSPCKRAGVRFTSGMICFDADLMRRLFGQVIHRIVTHIRDLMRDPQISDIKCFFIVGGFGECSLLQHALRQEFGKTVSILVPEEASLAVIKGAVQFGHNPSTVTARICPRTYGFGRSPEFIPGVHDSRRKVIINGVERCNGVFQPIVNKGEQVSLGELKSREMKPVRQDQNEATINLFSTENVDACYTDDEEVYNHGSIYVAWPGVGMDRKLVVNMTFAETEITVQAVAYPGGITAFTKIDFIK